MLKTMQNGHIFLDLVHFYSKKANPSGFAFNRYFEALFLLLCVFDHRQRAIEVGIVSQSGLFDFGASF